MRFSDWGIRLAVWLVLSFLVLAGLANGQTRVLANWSGTTIVTADELTTGEYRVVEHPGDLTMDRDSEVAVTLKLENASDTSWSKKDLRLGAVYPDGAKDRHSVWLAAGWLANNRIAPSDDTPDQIGPGAVATFSFTLHSPKYGGAYREYFQPLLERDHWLSGQPVSLAIQVGELTANLPATELKEMYVFRHDQNAVMVENGEIVANFIVSTGKPGYTTPAGAYRIYNKAVTAYSAEYKLWMPHWMGLINEETGIFLGYGMHGLPFWKTYLPWADGTVKDGRLYIAGRLYEAYTHLGRAVSHGCIRYDVTEAGVIYNWIS